MNPKGIIRKIDDIGRIVIPKTIRTTLNISENEPLEIVLEGKKIIISKCSAEVDWQTLANLGAAALPPNTAFALYDNAYRLKTTNMPTLFPLSAVDIDSNFIEPLKKDYGYLIFTDDSIDYKLAVGIINTYIENTY